MVGLLDIAPLTKDVPVGENNITVGGVSAHGIASLLSKFPELRKMMSGGNVDVAVDDLVAIVPDAIAAIIAAGCGCPGDPKAEAIAASLSADAQADLLKAILELTMPKGARPFFDKLTATFRSLDVSVRTADTQSPPPLKS